MKELISSVSLHKHTLIGITKRNNSYNDWARPLTVLCECLEHINVYVTFEESFIICSERYYRNKMSDRQMDGQKMRNIVNPYRYSFQTLSVMFTTF